MRRTQSPSLTTEYESMPDAATVISTGAKRNGEICKLNARNQQISRLRCTPLEMTNVEKPGYNNPEYRQTKKTRLRFLNF